MHSYCTLFDSFYLSRGLAMYESLSEHSSNFTLYIFPFDSITENVLYSLNLKNVVIVPLRDFETPELLEVKKERSKAEYCWTCTPSVISYVIDKYETADCTYLDSDLFFYSDPSVLISELDKTGKSVLITEHRYSFLPRLYEEKRAGRFCVQFMTFKNEKNSLSVLDTWRKQCIDWCFARHEDGKFGDQKYLDEWPVKYDNIHILNHQGGGVAPWNIQKYSFNSNGNSFTGVVRKSKTSFKIIFYHFQYVKILENDSYDIGWYLISSQVRKLFYLPYLRKLSVTEERLHRLNNNFSTGFTSFSTGNFKDMLKTMAKRYFRYNILDI